jgi:uncharacterized protein
MDQVKSFCECREASSMKIGAAILWLFPLTVLAIQTQSHPATPSTAQQTRQRPATGTLSSEKSKLDPAKETDIRRLLNLTGVKSLATQMMDGMQQSVKPMMTNSLPPGEYREKLVDLFFVKFRSKADPQQMLDLAVPIYDKYYSHEEIKGLIQFYETPLGQKTISLLPKMMGELQEEGRQMGREPWTPIHA